MRIGSFPHFLRPYMQLWKQAKRNRIEHMVQGIGNSITGYFNRLISLLLSNQIYIFESDIFPLLCIFENSYFIFYWSHPIHHAHPMVQHISFFINTSNLIILNKSHIAWFYTSSKNIFWQSLSWAVLRHRLAIHAGYNHINKIFYPTVGTEGLLGLYIL